ncbi:hypothetical protein OUZ56_022385 [Daphnia magna]|uniref:Uncharacterized protein n=1 Tax=Daphnia magna TaxID=35525 RepID=A0ABR0AW74_9CRUS|nr:hypothetical protein OUZ56_022385 [Daphnia magna]
MQNSVASGWSKLAVAHSPNVHRAAAPIRLRQYAGDESADLVTTCWYRRPKKDDKRRMGNHTLCAFH